MDVKQLNSEKPKLTLGPCLFNWKVNEWRDFYYQIADNDNIDEVYLGEVVCHKRYPFFEVALSEVIARLQESGKKVNISTLSLILGEWDMKATRNISNTFYDNFDFEANDIALIPLMNGKKFIVGPTINVYNEATLVTLENKGAFRFCFPYEIDQDSLKIMAKSTNAEKEIFAFGRMPLAIAARCYHARIHGTPKDDCRYVCEKDYNGKDISTLVDENFLTINGTQTMSYTYVNLVNEIDKLLEMGINIFRISPHFIDMSIIIGLFKQVLNKSISSQEALIKMQEALPLSHTFSNGFFYGEEGRNYRSAE